MPQQIDRHTLSLIISERTGALDLDSFSPADWGLLLQRAQEEGVAPLVYRALSKSGMPASMPETVHSTLRAMYVSLRMNNEALLRELENLIRQFDRAGIPVVALKGICFALTIYPEIGLRPMGDLDLLAPTSRAPDALRIAREAGYAEILPEAFPGIDGLLGHAVALQKSAAPFAMLELHHTLVAEKSFAYAVPVDWFWTQTEPLHSLSPQWQLRSLRMLSPTAQMLYASAHAMLQHGGRNTNLRWLYDLDQLIRTYHERLDWRLLLAQARVFEWSSAMSAALSQTVTFFGTPVPQDVLDELSKRLDRNTPRVVMMRGQPATHTLEEFQKWKSLNWRGRVRMALALAFPSPAYMRWRYGLKSSGWIPAYYLYRWWGIVKDASRTTGLLVRKFFAKPIRLDWN